MIVFTIKIKAIDIIYSKLNYTKHTWLNGIDKLNNYIHIKQWDVIVSINKYEPV